MKYIKISLAVAALLTLFVSCTKRTFEPVLGDTKVQFVNTSMEISLTGQYHFVPIQMVEQSSTSALATVELVSAVATLTDGSTREIVEREKTDTVAAEIIFTSKEVYIGPYDSTTDGTGLPYNNLEFRLPNYRDYQSVTLEFKLVGNNLAENTSCVYTASKPQGVIIEGTYAVEDKEFVFIKETDTKYWFEYAVEGGDISAERIDNTLIFSLTDYTEAQGYKLQICACHDGYYYPEEAAQVTFNATGLTLDNGMFYGDFEAGAAYFGIMAGATGTRK